MIGVNEWIRQRIQVDGYDSAVNAYDEFRAAFGEDAGRPDTYARACRRQRKGLQEKLDPRVVTLEDAVEWGQSAGAKSAWTAESGYRSEQSATGVIWDKDGGDEYVYRCKVGKA